MRLAAGHAQVAQRLLLASHQAARQPMLPAPSPPPPPPGGPPTPAPLPPAALLQQHTHRVRKGLGVCCVDVLGVELGVVTAALGTQVGQDKHLLKLRGRAAGGACGGYASEALPPPGAKQGMACSCGGSSNGSSSEGMRSQPSSSSALAAAAAAAAAAPPPLRASTHPLRWRSNVEPGCRRRRLRRDLGALGLGRGLCGLGLGLVGEVDALAAAAVGGQHLDGGAVLAQLQGWGAGEGG
jgi:hypothetical protein